MSNKLDISLKLSYGLILKKERQVIDMKEELIEIIENINDKKVISFLYGVITSYLKTKEKINNQFD